MINLSKQASRPIPVDLNIVYEIVDDALKNAKYDRNGVLIEFNQKDMSRRFKSPRGLSLTVDFVFIADPKRTYPYVAAYNSKSKTVSIYYSDLYILERSLLPEQLEMFKKHIMLGEKINFKLPPVMHDKRREHIAKSLVHELTHALDYKLRPGQRSEYADIAQDVLSKDDSTITKYRKRYYNSPEEVRAYMAQIVFEIQNLYKTYGTGLRDLMPRSHTLQEMLYLYGKDILKKEVINKIYSAVYQWMTDNNIDPHTGQKKTV